MTFMIHFGITISLGYTLNFGRTPPNSDSVLWQNKNWHVIKSHAREYPVKI